MFKLFVGALGGVFVTAFVIEIMRRKKPETMGRLAQKARKAANGVAIPSACQQETSAENLPEEVGV